MADEEALLVVVGIDEPAGDSVGAVAADLAGVGVEDVDTVDPDPELLAFATVSLDREYVDPSAAPEEVTFKAGSSEWTFLSPVGLSQ